jgi:hypothetical protein
MDLLWRNQIDPAKVVMGTGFYGRSFTLSDPSCSHAGCAFSGGGDPGPCSASAGTLMYSEIQDIIDAGATTVVDKDAAVAIVTWDNNQWVSYDNADTLKQKVDYANSKCLGGLMVWAASTDDASGTAIKALNGAAGRSLDLSQRSLFGSPKPPAGQCVWGDCDTGCPSGFQPAKGSGGKVSGYAGIFNGCPKGKSRYYCCPTGSTAPQCTWKGSPKFCGLLSKNRCKSNEVEVTTTTVNPADGTSCWTGHMSLCCTQTQSDSDIDACSTYCHYDEGGTQRLIFVQLGKVLHLSALRLVFYLVLARFSHLTAVLMMRWSRPPASMAREVSSHACTTVVSNLFVVRNQVSLCPQI